MDEYGNEASQYTMNRSAFGDVAAGMMMGAHTVGAGAYGGARNMFSDLGSQVMPAHYTPPARVMTGYYGQYVQRTGFFSSGMAAFGLGSVPRGTTAMEYGLAAGGDFGERMGSGAAAGGLAIVGAAAAHFGGAMVGRGMGSAIGGFFGSALGPAGTVAGAAVGGFLGGTIAPYVASSMANAAIIGAVNQRREIQGFLESASFRFMGPGSPMADPRTGSGMSRAARQDVSEFIRRTDISDPMLNTQDLTKILGSGTQLGLFNGTQDMADFKKKFKDITESVKTVTSVLHTTLEEGMKTIKDLRAIGIDPSAVRGMTSLADMTGRVAGRTGLEMMGLGLQGAEMFRGTGITMGIGFQANMMNVAAIRAARDANTISQETISQAGGEEALAQRMTAGGMAFSQSSMGRGMGAAFYAGGGLNGGAFMNAMANGGGDFISTFQRAAQNIGNPAALRTYQANQEKFMSEMGASFGGRGMQMFQMGAAASQATYLSGITKASRETEFINVLKEQGVAMPDIQAMLGQVTGRDAVFGAAQASAGMTSAKLTAEEASQNFILNRVGKRVHNLVASAEDVVARPLNRLVDSVGEFGQVMSDRLYTGIVRADASGVDVAGLPAGGPSPSLAGINASSGNFLTGDAARNFRNAYESGALSGLDLGISRGSKTGIGLGAMAMHSGRPGFGGDLVYAETQISEAGLNNLMARAPILTMGLSEAQRVAKTGDITGVNRRLGAAVLSGKIGTGAGMENLIEAAFTGKTQQNISSNEFAALRVSVQGTALEENFTAQQRAVGLATGVEGVAMTKMLAGAVDKFNQHKASMDKAAGGKLAFGVPELMAQAVLARTPEEAARFREEAAGRQMHSGTAPSDVRSMLAGAGGISHDEAQGLIASGQLVARGMAVRGQGMLADALEIQATGKSFDDDSKRRSQAMDVAGRVRTTGLASLTKDDLNAFKGTDIQAFLTHGYEDFQKLRGGKQLSEKDLRGVIANYVGGEAQQNELMKTFRSGDHGVDSVIQALGDALSQKVSGSKAAAAAGGALGGTSDQPNAAQSASLQTSINLSTLAVMQGLATKLGVK